MPKDGQQQFAILQGAMRLRKKTTKKSPKKKEVPTDVPHLVAI
jgi:hypothetical protein